MSCVFLLHYCGDSPMILTCPPEMLPDETVGFTIKWMRKDEEEIYRRANNHKREK